MSEMNKMMANKNENEQKNTDNRTKKYELSIENFICDEYSICREERQYAVFLYNILRKYRTPESRKGNQNVQAIFAACGLDEDISIDHVFYEATFMRDFFERNRRLRLSDKSEWESILKLNKTSSRSNSEIESEHSFNTKLIQYACETIYGVCEEKNRRTVDIHYSAEEHNLGRHEIEVDKLLILIKGISDTKQCLKYIVKWMMNAKPDIAVIYHKEPSGQNAQKYLLFLECKFESGESVYSYKDENGTTFSKTQREIQWMVADFLCQGEGYLKAEGIDMAKWMKDNGKSRLVEFIRSDEKPTKADGRIPICQLIELNHDIFEDGKR